MSDGVVQINAISKLKGIKQGKNTLICFLKVNILIFLHKSTTVCCDSLIVFQFLIEFSI